MGFLYHSLVVRERLGECFKNRVRANRLQVSLVKELEGFLEFVTDDLLLARCEAVKQANRDILRAALTLDDEAYETASKAWGRAYNRAVVYTMSPEDFGKTPTRPAWKARAKLANERHHFIDQEIAKGTPKKDIYGIIKRNRPDLLVRNQKKYRRCCEMGTDAGCYLTGESSMWTTYGKARKGKKERPESRKR